MFSVISTKDHSWFSSFGVFRWRTCFFDSKKSRCSEYSWCSNIAGSYRDSHGTEGNVRRRWENDNRDAVSIYDVWGTVHTRCSTSACWSSFPSLNLDIFLITPIKWVIHSFKIAVTRGWIDVQWLRVLEGTCSCRAPAFCSQHPHGNLQQPIPPVLGDPVPSYGCSGHQACALCTDIYAVNYPYTEKHWARTRQW